jgi:hypothetical protein
VTHTYEKTHLTSQQVWEHRSWVTDLNKNICKISISKPNSVRCILGSRRKQIFLQSPKLTVYNRFAMSHVNTQDRPSRWRSCFVFGRYLIKISARGAAIMRFYGFPRSLQANGGT